jgi:hypothetical protein
VLPTLNGRIQTRIAVLGVVGGIWTLILTPFLGIAPSLSDAYRITFIILAATIVLGVGWEFIYHFIMQFRWEKDWPILLGLLTMINEGALVYFLLYLKAIPGITEDIPIGLFLIDFITTWVIVWLVTLGPMRVPFIHWRFRGGRLI